VISAKICASRDLAYSSDSNTNIPDPSPITNPSRSASKGRLAVFGSSLRVDNAPITLIPATANGMIAASDPPARTTSACPRLIISADSPTALVPVAQAVTTAMFGPRTP